ncbi:type II toxin-antitoxin system VapC family toxin [Silvibacterium dinghuense]|uniref:Type II toxin-antitoxin system VapC family toxin n=1 Tax=Silvibacterium dinghuense TaxID=1560006 RepID=A0A4Q1SJ25_9BACT|nr:type II toxin-antitoxin system VapC family toxin [Silvibacterium dinghuense]RXS97631.1 type II toxin-antitoxin system VapC family toxin [Silvibacterium dinghuense]GGH00694.1 twitching motility protein PilT [Silvibacterium dinghuense]
MKLLLDTHLVLWATISQSRLPASARRLILDPSHQPYFSAVNLWEIAIKNSLLREDFHVDTRRLRQSLLKSGYKELSVTSEHAIAVEELPLLHRDPFDRILIAQAIVEGLTLLTADSIVAKYEGPVEKV